jgi:hypothetical protein
MSRQFLDIGTGLPTADNTHDVAQRVAPEAKIVYADIAPEESAELALRYNAMSSAMITPRSREQVARFFARLQMLPPGLVPIAEWGLPKPIDTTVGGLVGYVGIAKKP